MSGKYWNYKVCVIDDQHNIKSMLVRDDIYSILVAPYICPTKLINSVTNNIYFSIKIDISLINLPTNGKCSIKKRVHGCQKLFLIIMDEYNMSGRFFTTCYNTTLKMIGFRWDILMLTTKEILSMLDIHFLLRALLYILGSDFRLYKQISCCW